MKDLYIVAHTQSQHHVDGLVGGWYDTPLTGLGQAQAKKVAARVLALAGGRPVEIFSSDLKRARQTADAIAAQLGGPIVEMPDLRERSMGIAGGKPDAWLQEHVEHAGRDGDRLDHRDGIGGAETKREFLTRLYRAMDAIVTRPCATQIVVTHGFALTYLVASWIRMPPEAAGWVNFKSASGGITHLHEDDVLFNRYVMRLSDTAHLA
jgi:broad specificity phosphatase PhoE